MKLTTRETIELIDTIKIAEKSIEWMTRLEHSARLGHEISKKEIWELKNFSDQIGAVLNNIASGMYRPARSS